jgi:hypothetical protein
MTDSAPIRPLASILGAVVGKATLEHAVKGAERYRKSARASPGGITLLICPVVKAASEGRWLALADRGRFDNPSRRVTHPEGEGPGFTLEGNLFN